ncbi:hypothetical protein V8B55DRAFT_1582667 [Mucor lusitanicus]
MQGKVSNITRMKRKAETPQFSIKRNKQVFKPLFEKINKAMKNADLDKAYQNARNSEFAALNSDKEHIFNIYAHIINIYYHRRSSLNNSIKDNTNVPNRFYSSLLKFFIARKKASKLAIESKDVLDHIVRHAASFDPRTDMALMLQVCQNQCDVKVFSLYDHGLYCLWKETSLSLPSCPKLFTQDADSWFAPLELILISAIKLDYKDWL